MNDASTLNEGYSTSFWPENIPPELRSLRQWGAWIWEERDGMLTKVPLRGGQAYLQNAASDDPTSWMSFENAVALMKAHSLPGVGFFFSEDDPYCGVDLDKCRDPKTGEIEPWAKEIIRQFDTYTEVSPSGTGVKLIMHGKVPGPRRRKGHIEMYDSRRFFTITGRVI